MGEKVEGAKNDGEKKAGDAGEITAVFKIDLHCEGCAKKVRRAVKHLPGVSDVKADSGSNKLTVTGKVDPAVIKAKVEQKTKKKIEIVSPPPKKDGGGGGDKKADEKVEKKTDQKAAEKKSEEKVEKKADGKSEKKTDEKAEKKPEEKKADDKKPKQSTVVLKMRLHCEGCIQKIRKAIIKFKGVDEITVDAQKDLITVKGTMEGKDLAGQLKDKFKRSVEVVVPPKKEEPAVAAPAVGDKKEKDGKAVTTGGDGGGTKIEVNKMEYNGYSYPSSTFYYGDSSVQSSSHYNHAMEAQPTYSFANSSGYYTNNQNYVHQGYNDMSIYNNNSHAPQMFSDENPNGCSVM